jgi:hypothetical protein
VEDQESLETSTLIRKLSDAVENQINNFLSDGVMTTGVVVGCIFLASDQLFRVEQLAVCTSANLIYDSRLKIDEHSSWYVLAGSCFTEESVEGVITATDRLVRRHLSIRLDTVLEAVQFPARIANLDSSLSDVD